MLQAQPVTHVHSHVKSPYPNVAVGHGVVHDSDYSMTNDAKTGKVVVRATQLATPPKGLSFLGRGYDIYKGNPRDFKAIGGDVGFKSRIFKLDFSAEETDDDQAVLKPKGTQIFPRKTCSTSFTSQLIDSTESLQKELDRDSSYDMSVSASFEYDGALVQGGGSFEGRWSGSKSFRSMAKSFEKRSSVYVVSEATCSVYEAHIQSHLKPGLDENFLAGIKDLPATYHGLKYHRFLQEFGTHVLVGGLWGSKYGKVYKMKTKELEKFKSEGSSVSRAASYAASAWGSGFGASGSASFSRSDESTNAERKEEASSFSSSVSSTKTYSFGARPPGEGGITAWAASSELEALPIQYTLQTVDHIVAIADPSKAKNIQKAFSDYGRYSKLIIPKTSDQMGDCYVARTYRTHATTVAKSLVARCDKGYTVMGGGFFDLTNSKQPNHLNFHNKLNWLFPAKNQFVCGSGNVDVDHPLKTSTLGECSALCCKLPSTSRVFTVRNRKEDNLPDRDKLRSSVYHAHCPEGTTVVGGGFMELSPEPHVWNEVLLNDAWSHGGRSGWRIRAAWGPHLFPKPEMAVYARCLESTAKVKPKCVIRRHVGKLNGLHGCPPFEMLTSIGYHVHGRHLPLAHPFHGTFFIQSSYMYERRTIGPRLALVNIGMRGHEFHGEKTAVCCDFGIENFENVVDKRLDDDCVTHPLISADEWTFCPAGREMRSIIKGPGKSVLAVNAAECCKSKTPDTPNHQCIEISSLGLHTAGNWVDAPPGYFFHGFFRLKNCHDLACIHRMKVCRKNGGPDEWGQCYTKAAHFSNKGAEVGCKAGYRIVGFYKSQKGHQMDSLGAIRCCEMNVGKKSSGQTQAEHAAISGKKIAEVDQVQRGIRLENKRDNKLHWRVVPELRPKDHKRWGAVLHVKAQGETFFGMMDVAGKNGFWVQVDSNHHHHDHAGLFYRHNGHDHRYFFDHYHALGAGVRWNNPHHPQAFWIRYDHGQFSFGKGAEIGLNQIYTYQHHDGVALRSVLDRVWLGTYNSFSSSDIALKNFAGAKHCQRKSGLIRVGAQKRHSRFEDLFVHHPGRPVKTMVVHEISKGTSFHIGWSDHAMREGYIMSLGEHDNNQAVFFHRHHAKDYSYEHVPGRWLSHSTHSQWINWHNGHMNFGNGKDPAKHHIKTSRIMKWPHNNPAWPDPIRHVMMFPWGYWGGGDRWLDITVCFWDG